MKKMKLRQAREAKEKTQEDMAEFLCMSQSQYQRRECGEIHITEDEWVRIAKVLAVDVDDIRENDPAPIYNYDNHNYDNNSGNYSASNNYFYNIPDYVMKNQQEYIERLKKEIDVLKTENVEYQKQIEAKDDVIKSLQDELKTARS